VYVVRVSLLFIFSESLQGYANITLDGTPIAAVANVDNFSFACVSLGLVVIIYADSRIRKQEGICCWSRSGASLTNVSIGFADAASLACLPTCGSSGDLHPGYQQGASPLGVMAGRSVGQGIIFVSRIMKCLMNIIMTRVFEVRRVDIAGALYLNCTGQILVAASATRNITRPFLWPGVFPLVWFPRLKYFLLVTTNVTSDIQPTRVDLPHRIRLPRNLRTGPHRTHVGARYRVRDRLNHLRRAGRGRVDIVRQRRQG